MITQKQQKLKLAIKQEINRTYEIFGRNLFNFINFRNGTDEEIKTYYNKKNIEVKELLTLYNKKLSGINGY